MSEATRRNSDKFMLRLPDRMREQISARASAARRSMNAEIVLAVEAHLGAAEPSADTAAAQRERRRMLALCLAECEEVERDHAASGMFDHGGGAASCAERIRVLMGEDGGRRIIVLAPDDGETD